MRLSGKKIEGANVEYIVIPRGDGNDIILKAQAVLDYDPFDKLCPPPKPPVVLRKGGEKSYNVEDPTFQIALQEHGQRRSAWTILTSLRLGTPELEWETVDFADPNTWTGYLNEFRAAGFSEVEIVRVMRGCMAANSLDDDRLDEARLRFLATRERRAVDGSFSLLDEPSDTESFVPVSASA